jgi:Fe2+ or Zn2+ uptake regulation protein
MRNTRASRLVTEILRACPTPLTLAELHARVREHAPQTAHSTVFRLITRFEQEGKVVRVDWRERGSRFEWAERPHHHHLVCGDCGRTVDIEDRDFGFSEARLRARTGFLVNHHSIELEGTCPDCQ